eukprot:244437-Rhodomonas_salina.1
MEIRAGAHDNFGNDIHVVSSVFWYGYTLRKTVPVGGGRGPCEGGSRPPGCSIAMVSTGHRIADA